MPTTKGDWGLGKDLQKLWLNYYGCFIYQQQKKKILTALFKIRNQNYLEESLSPNKAFQVNQSRPATGWGRTREEGQAGLGPGAARNQQPIKFPPFPWNSTWGIYPALLSSTLKYGICFNTQSFYKLAGERWLQEQLLSPPSPGRFGKLCEIKARWASTENS